MKILALTVALLFAASPVAAQQQRQQALGAGGQTKTSILPNNGLQCIEEMVATFCNQPTSPNLAGYGSSTKFVGSSATTTARMFYYFILPHLLSIVRLNSAWLNSPGGIGFSSFILIPIGTISPWGFRW